MMKKLKVAILLGVIAGTMIWAFAMVDLLRLFEISVLFLLGAVSVMAIDRIS